jgi:hypothetical protein
MRFLICSFLMMSSLVFAQEGDPLFQSDEILQVTIEGPLDTLIRKKSKEDYLDGHFRYTEADGSLVEFDLKLRARGNFRHENCAYPPVRLNFKTSQTKKTLFHKQDKLKLVVHCSRSAQFQQIILQEYLAYRFLNTLTDLSMRVRLLQVTYIDTDKQRQREPRYAFLIEHKDRTAKRLELKPLTVKGTTVAEVNPELLNLTSVFQYFIGNTDFSPIAGPAGEDCCHNYILFQNPGNLITPIPYDFDQAGLVDAPYANPNPMFGLRTVRQRHYRGRCLNNSYVDASVQRFKDEQEAIYSLIEEQQGLSDKARKNLLSYVDKFYNLIADPDKVEKSLRKRCV